MRDGSSTLDSITTGTFKVIVVGDGNAGKTSLLRRYVKGEFHNAYQKTVNADFMIKEVYVRDCGLTATLVLWDTAGQEVYNSLSSSYYRGAVAAIICFSSVDLDSFANVPRWKEKVECVCGTETLFAICQTKVDLPAAVSRGDAEGLAIRTKCPLFRSSNRDDYNIDQLFEYISAQCLKRSARGQAASEHRGEEPGPPTVAWLAKPPSKARKGLSKPENVKKKSKDVPCSVM
jgi:Rab family protein